MKRNNRVYTKKQCEAARERARQWYLDNKKQALKHSKEYRNSHKKEIILSKKEWYLNNKKARSLKSLEYREANKEKVSLQKKKWYLANKEKVIKRMVVYNRTRKLQVSARSKANNAIISGKLIKMPCESCGSRKYIQAHHSDYNKPLYVNWLCKKHHYELHSPLKSMVSLKHERERLSANF